MEDSPGVWGILIAVIMGIIAAFFSIRCDSEEKKKETNTPPENLTAPEAKKIIVDDFEEEERKLRLVTQNETTDPAIRTAEILRNRRK